MIGDTFGPYTIVAKLGEGGMGEVYRARDATLNRDVAVKVLPELFANDAERLARFRREAQVLAALNHPHIAQVYGFDDSTGVGALVMELVDGPTLADLIAQGPMTWSTALPLAKQIVEAITAAHEQGIVHRDLKPANIKVRQDGTVKVLDFGLARLAMPDASSVDGDAARSPTMTAAATRAGVILGTAAYMSPEQAKGLVADKRSDVWAFGAVLYEMLAGRRAFEGEDIADTLAAVLRGEPDWTAFSIDVPSHVRTVIQRCLTKDRRQRVGDMSTVAYVFADSAIHSAGQPVTTTPVHDARPTPLWQRVLIPMAAALAASGAVAAVLWPAAAPTPPRITRFAITPTGPQTLQIDAQSHDLAITPNGSHVVYKGGASTVSTQLFVRAVGDLEPAPLGTTIGAPKAPFTSPDGQWIGYFEPQGPVTLKKVAITGGPPLVLAQVDGASRGAAWRPDDNIIFATSSLGTGLQRVPAAGGTPMTLTKPNRELGENDHLWPRSLPGRPAVLFTITLTSGGVDNSHIAVMDEPTGTYKVVLKGGSQAVYTSSGHLVYVAAGALRAIAFDLERLETSGNASQALPRVVTLPTGEAEFDIAADGTLIYVAEGAGTAPSQRTMVWVDRKGREEAIPRLPARAYNHIQLSPDGSRVAVEIADQAFDIWVWSFARSTLTRLTADPGFDSSPVWTPDGASLVFRSQIGGAAGSLFRQLADGSGSPELLTDVSELQSPTQVLPNGKDIILWQARSTPSSGAGGSPDLMLLTLGNRETRPLLQTPTGERSAMVSPDGRWIAYQSTESGPGQAEVFIRPFPTVTAGRIQLSTDGGAEPVWARNGRELFYKRPDGSLMSVSVTPGEQWTAGVPTPLLERPPYFTRFGGSQSYDVTPDGSRFLMIKNSASADSSARTPSIVVVQQWTEELKRIVPVTR